MVKKYVTSIITIIFMTMALVGCSSSSLMNNKAKIPASSTQVEEIKPTSSKTDETENKSLVTAAEENNKAADNKETSIEMQKVDNTEVTAASKKEDKTNKEISNTAQKDKKKKVIVIDPGHGGKSTSEKEPVSPGSTTMKAKNVSGATGVSTKTPEHTIALKVSQMLKDQLSTAGYTVIMTRTSASETIGNIERAEIGNKNNADLVIRIHADSSEDSSIKGASMLVPGDVGYAKDISKISKKYGELIFNTLLNEVGMNSRGIISRTDLTGFNWSKVPVVLIEMGFLSNQDEDKLLSSDSYQSKLALGLFKGIEKALGN